jgi:superkiller protein 3
LLGSGAGNFYAKYPYYQSRSLDYTYFTNNDFYRSGHSHNDFIQFAAEYGIPGAGIMFAIFALVFITGFKYLKKQEKDKLLVIGMLSGITGLLIHAIFNFPFQIIPTTVVFYLFLSMLVFGEKEFSSREVPVTSPARTAGVALAVIFIAAAVIAVRALASDSYLRSAKEADYFKQPANAAGYAARAISITPWNEDELYFYGELLEKQDKKEESYRIFEKVYKINRTYWEAMPRVFQYYMEQGMKVRALEVGEEMFKMSPYAKKSIIALGYAYFINGRNDDAIKICEQGLKYYPDDSTLLDQVSGIYGSIGNYDKTIFYAQKAIEAEPDFSEPYYNMGLAYFKTKNYSEAEKMIKKMLVLEPNSDKGKNLLEAIKHAK